MLIILDYKKSIIHFSYCHQNEISVSRGLYFKGDNTQSKEEVCILHIPCFAKNYENINDFRYLIKNRFELNLYKIIILLLNRIINYIIIFKKIMNRNVIKIVFNILLFIIFLLTFYFLIGGSYFKVDNVSKNSEFLIDEWKDFVEKFASIKLNNSQGFVNGKLAIINGINDYQLLVVKHNEENYDKNFYLAVYYDNIIFIDKNNKSLSIKPTEFCKIGDKKYFVYKLSLEKKIIIFNNYNNFDLKTINKFSLVLEEQISEFLKNKNLNNICRYLVLN